MSVPPGGNEKTLDGFSNFRLQKNIIKLFLLFKRKENRKNSGRIVWINTPQYCGDIFNHEIYSEELNRKHVFINCCNLETAKIFGRLKYETIKVGKEALLKLHGEHFSEKRLKESVRAGLRHGCVKEYFYDEDNVKKLEDFKTVCRHGDEPQLKFFFNDKFMPENRLLVLENEKNKWLGALLIFEVNEKTVKTDLILRRKNAPNGVMEALIYKTFFILKREGYKEWSLGEVPYIVYDSRLFSKEYFINALGRRSRFAYNYSGLYRFKNKFNPVWNDVFICAKSGLNFGMLCKILIQSNLIFLVLQKAFTILFQTNG